ncbi:hypothetical protein GCM10023238_32410 [Streptomyces heliomycini]
MTDGATYTASPTAPTGTRSPRHRTVSDGRLTVGAPGKGNLRVYVLNGPGKIGTDGPYLK